MSLNTPCSPYKKCNEIVFFPRMLDKIRMKFGSVLSDDYLPSMGAGLDWWCCCFLGVNYGEIVELVRLGYSDENVFHWAIEHGNSPTGEQKKMWNEFMVKRGWRDDATPHLKRRLKDIGAEDHSEIQTFFDCIEFEEGRAIMHSLDQMVH